MTPSQELSLYCLIFSSGPIKFYLSYSHSYKSNICLIFNQLSFFVQCSKLILFQYSPISSSRHSTMTLTFY
ncbi:hypothetical protein FGO68_gene6978 [Halteria grandinella]|uniref:Uncharacterized protein n=1 Tax=Halteria grandinella TaxID=5974 RepID=A0A8J8NEM7_HALGN|nr:hypothetical protein FGO68_gene6978 [Halteria grandinella]